MAELGARDALRVLELLERGKAHAAPQEEALATYTSKIEKNDLTLEWTLPAEHIRRRVRGLAETPGAVTVFRGGPLKVIACKVVAAETTSSPGAVMELRRNEGVVVACGGGNLLLTAVQPVNKSIMPAWAWNVGARIEPGEKLG